MSWRITDEEIRQVVRRSPEVRYKYSIKRMAEWEEVWTLKSTAGFVMAGDDAGHEIVPVWPHAKYAELTTVGLPTTDSWADAHPISIQLQDWINKWIPGIKKDGRKIVVFPRAGDTLNGLVVSPDFMLRDLLEELDKYE